MAQREASLAAVGGVDFKPNWLAMEKHGNDAVVGKVGHPNDVIVEKDDEYVARMEMADRLGGREFGSRVDGHDEGHVDEIGVRESAAKKKFMKTPRAENVVK